ncbi:amidase [Saccharothrix algeriensis]|uniref:Amidase n=1 Tax=Saccharothrix algeriensis TaxID=173560 RepID=A0A8T8HXZ5_9PSEU|nr:amidase [Saccharothrix algeriensis]MBM7815221.1 amidase [Saccharothrix algeriensis]QTR03455.1 amidase [Saccharothrix algeriensis]
MRSLLAALLAVLLVAPPAHAHGGGPGLGFDLDSATIPQLARRLDAGTLTSVDLTRAYLRRIDTVDRRVRSVVAVDPTALGQAAESDRRRDRGRARGPLDGIPVLLKDNIDTKGLASTAGSRALRVPPRRDAELVGRLRAAGAVVLGKTNLSEWANFRSTRSTSGWSGVGGQTNNPHVLDRNPCGSSSGSGAAVAASLAQVAVGTETDGSIVCPAGQNGVVGLKPTLGAISGEGIVPISSRQDTAGPMARHVVDAAILMSVLDRRGGDYATAAGADVLRGARVGVWRKAGASPEADRVVQAAVDALRRSGATVVDVELPYQEQIDAVEFPALITEFKHDLERYLATRPGAPRTLDELIRFNERDPVELSKFGQELFLAARDAPPLTDPTYRQQRDTATGLARRSIDEVLAAHRLDVVMAPTNSPAWRTDHAAGDAYVLGTSTPAAAAGYPNATVPAGFAGPLPIGVSFMAGRDADARVLRFAAAFEHTTRARQAPRYLPALP